MRLAILSRNKNLHSIRRLLQEARKIGMECIIVNPLECQLVVDGKASRILIGNNILPPVDAVLPRIGASITDYGLSVVKQFETMGIPIVNPSWSISESRDKMKCLQFLTQHGLRVPATVLSRSNRGISAAVQAVNGLPVVLKLLQGTQGVGVMLVNTPITLGSVLDTFRSLEKDVILQQFLAEGAGRDYRAFVVGGKVVAAMMRKAAKGEFRSNIHRGGQGLLIKLPLSFEKAAIAAAKHLGLQVAGVDLMESKAGPMIIEVNSSPGFEGIEKATGLNVAGLIIKESARIAKKRR